MELAVYILKRSDREIAELLGVKPRTVSSWRRMERVPSPMQSLNIIQKSNGKVDWKGIYQPYALYRARKMQQNPEKSE
jgi:DNA-binding transcriptional regulator YdaS (Cro superfamily)